jgi:hypothetical protein
MVGAGSLLPIWGTLEITRLYTKWASSFNFIKENLQFSMEFSSLLGSAPIGIGTIALDPTFGSFTLLEPVSH